MSKLEEKKGDLLPDIEISVRSKVKVPKDLVDFLQREFIKFHGEDVYNRVIQYQNWHLILLTPKAIMIEPIVHKHCHKIYSTIVTYNKNGVAIVATGKIESTTLTKKELDNHVIDDLEHLLTYANKRFHNKKEEM
jgi:hypothetical protein